MSDLQSQNFIRISATTITPPSVRRHEQEVAKLIEARGGHPPRPQDEPRG